MNCWKLLQFSEVNDYESLTRLEELMRIFELETDIQNRELEITTKKKVGISEFGDFIIENQKNTQLIKSGSLTETKLGQFLLRLSLESGTNSPIVIFKHKNHVHKEYIWNLYRRSVLGLQESYKESPNFDSLKDSVIDGIVASSLIDKRYPLLESTEFGFKKIRTRLTERFSDHLRTVRKDIPKSILDVNSKRRKINNIIHRFRDRYLQSYKRESTFIQNDSLIIQDIYFPDLRLGIKFSEEITEPSMNWIQIKSGRLYQIYTPSLVKNSDIDEIYELIKKRIIQKF